MWRGFTVRAATFDDADDIATVHMASIHSLGAAFYGPQIVRQWGRPRDGSGYVAAMERGERIFVAVGSDDDETPVVVGFSSYRVEEGKHRTAVYVAGRWSRRGVGSSLLGAAERAARENQATEIHVAASLAAVEFYRANGFEVTGRGEHTLRSGETMACVFMRKP